MTFSLRLRRALRRCSVLLTVRTSSKPTANSRWPPVLRAVHALRGRASLPQRIIKPARAWRVPVGVEGLTGSDTHIKDNLYVIC